MCHRKSTASCPFCVQQDTHYHQSEALGEIKEVVLQIKFKHCFKPFKRTLFLTRVIIIYFCYWSRQKCIIFGKVCSSVALSAAPSGIAVLGWNWQWLVRFLLCSQPISYFFNWTVGGNVELPVWSPMMLAFQENAYKCTINCQELSLLLQFSCNLQDSITWEISCGLTNSTAIKHKKCSVWCIFGFYRIRLIYTAFLNVLTLLPGTILLKIIIIFDKWFFFIFILSWIFKSCVCCGKISLISTFCLLCNIISISFGKKKKKNLR